MKKEEVENLKKFVENQNKKSNEKCTNLQFTNDLQKLKNLEELDKVKSRILKYIVYKKRTEAEIRNKFKCVFDENIFEDAIENLKELGYINDINYIDRQINEYKSLKNMSLKEMKYKLLSKGLNKSIIEDYFSENYDDLLEFEEQSAENIFSKKIISMEVIEVKNYLRKKGYLEDTIKNAEHIYNGDN